MQFKSLLSIWRRFFLITIGFILISGFIGLFNNGIKISLDQYIQNIVSIVTSLLNPSELVITNNGGKQFSMFPLFWDYYLYSVVLFLAAIILSFFLGLLISFLVHLLPGAISNIIFKISSFIESLPDILVLMIIQYIVILFFKQTGILLFPVAEYDEKIYALPIFTLSILPSILIFRITHLLIRDETTKPYIDLARSKGFSQAYIFFKHILPNISYSLLNHFKSITLLTLSNLIIFERLFNFYGITHFMLTFPQMNVICLSLIMFYIPIFIILMLFNFILERKTGQKVVM